MAFTFEIRKAAQVVGALLKLERTPKMNYLKLLKLLYILDRESLRQTGQPITGGWSTAMKHGPVLREVYDFIKERSELDSSEVWNAYFKTNGYELSMLQDPGDDELSRYEVGKIEDVHAKFGHLTEWELVEYTHTFEEWQRNNPGNSSQPIPLSHILGALGLSAKTAEQIQADADEDRLMARIFRDS